jgi:hypothetical protein
MAQANVRRITIVEVSGSVPSDVPGRVVWLCRSLGLEPEHDKLAFEVFLHVLDASRKGEGVRTIEITKTAHVTQAAVVYHMNSLMSHGLIEKRGRLYYLRGGCMDSAISAMEEEFMHRMRMLRNAALTIDRGLGR